MKWNNYKEQINNLSKNMNKNLEFKEYILLDQIGSLMENLSCDGYMLVIWSALCSICNKNKDKACSDCCARIACRPILQDEEIHFSEWMEEETDKTKENDDD